MAKSSDKGKSKPKEDKHLRESANKKAPKTTGTRRPNPNQPETRSKPKGE